MGGDYIGFRYWTNPGPFVNGINGFGQSFVLAAVYYCGTELIAITAGESRQPNKDVPKVRTSLTCWMMIKSVAKGTDLGNQTNHIPRGLYLLGHDLLRWYQRCFGRS